MPLSLAISSSRNASPSQASVWTHAGIALCRVCLDAGAKARDATPCKPCAIRRSSLRTVTPPLCRRHSALRLVGDGYSMPSVRSSAAASSMSTGLDRAAPGGGGASPGA